MRTASYTASSLFILKLKRAIRQSMTRSFIDLIYVVIVGQDALPRP